MGKGSEHFVRPAAKNDLENMKQHATRKNIPLPSLMNTVWGKWRALCPSCAIDMMPREYVGHYERRHGIIEEE